MAVRHVCIVFLCVTGISSCPNNWLSFDGSCYHIPNMQEDWATAAAACRTLNANLAEVKDEFVQNFLKHTAKAFQASNPNVNEFWLGGTDEFVEGDWFWIKSGTRFGYKDWHEGEPNNKDDEDCLGLMDFGGSFCWNDALCSDIKYFICETAQENITKQPGLNNTGNAWVPIG